MFPCFNLLVHSFLTLLPFHLHYLDNSFYALLFHRLVEMLCDEGITLGAPVAVQGPVAISFRHLMLYIATTLFLASSLQDLLQAPSPFSAIWEIPACTNGEEMCMEQLPWEVLCLCAATEVDADPVDSIQSNTTKLSSAQYDGLTHGSPGLYLSWM